VGASARDVQTLLHEVAALRADIEQYRAELRGALDRLLDVWPPHTCRALSNGSADGPHAEYVSTVRGMATPLLTEGDLDRGQPPDLTSPHWRCGIVDPATGAACTLRPHRDDESHRGYQAVQGGSRSTRLVSWTGGTERAMVVDGYTWSRLPGTDVEVRALTNKPLALRYRPSRQS
jgi:hypothetical protein